MTGADLILRLLHHLAVPGKSNHNDAATFMRHAGRTQDLGQSHYDVQSCLQ